MIPPPFEYFCRILLLTFLVSAPLFAQTKIPVQAELERLSMVHGFALVGLAVTGDAVARVSTEDIYPRLRSLLVDFDHIIVQAPGGGIERVIILGEKKAYEPPAPPVTAGGNSGAGHIELKTSLRGTQHAVQVSLEGAGGKRISRELLVDTGADHVVLPASLLGALGLPAASLQPSEMQTANGRVQARLGNLPALWLGQNRIENIPVAFLEDAKLGNSGLLGMSVLNRYSLTIDDKAGHLTLDAKGGAKPGQPSRVVAEGSPPGAGQGEGSSPEVEMPPPEPPGLPIPEGAPDVQGLTR